MTYKDLEALDKPSVQYDAGGNMIIHKHNIKLTLQYSSRPLYEGDFASGLFTAAGMKGLLIFQTQVCF
jgi:hypothetical protein